MADQPPANRTAVCIPAVTFIWEGINFAWILNTIIGGVEGCAGVGVGVGAGMGVGVDVGVGTGAVVDSVWVWV